MRSDAEATPEPFRWDGHVAALAAALNGAPGVSGWSVALTHREEAQLFLIGAREEARRLVEDERARVTVYHTHAPHVEADGASLALGMTTFTALPAEIEDAAALGALLRDATLAASLTDNQPYALPGPPASGYPGVETNDPDLLGDMEAELERAASQLRAEVAVTPGVRLASVELYATRARMALRTSAGVRATSASTSVHCDLALLAGEGLNAAEFHVELRRRRLRDLNIAHAIPAYGAFARHSLEGVPPSSWRGPVVVSGDAAAQFFNPYPTFFHTSPFVAHSSAELKRQGMSRFAPGELVTPEEPRGDRLTLVSDPTRPWGVRSAPFDEDGLPATRVTLIADGVFRAYWADARFAAFLGATPTGNFGNLTVGLGSAPERALRDVSRGPVYEIVAFSWFNPDTLTGDFNAEIRLGYRHDASGVTPIKGGALTGNIFTAFSDARFSAEPFTDGIYYGPAAIRFGDLTIAGV